MVESHVHAGGAAHAFVRDGFTFDSGPSLFSGLSQDRSPNPLKHVLDFIGEEVEWLNYDTWGVVLPEGSFAAPIGPEPFKEVIGALLAVRRRRACIIDNLRFGPSPLHQPPTHSIIPSPLDNIQQQQ